MNAAMKSPSAVLRSTALLAAAVAFSACKSTSSTDGAPAAESEKNKAKRTDAEAAFYEACGKMGELGGNVAGKDGFKFSAAELLQISRLNSTAAATGSIADYAQQLRSQGIDLIVVPVPPKAFVYPDKLSGVKVPMKSRRPARLDSPLKAAMDELEAKKVKVVDLLPVLIAGRDGKAGPAFPRSSTTWSPEGVRLAAEAIAEAVADSKAGRGSVTGISAEPVTLTFSGAMSIGDDGAKPETFQTSKIGRITGDKVRSLAFGSSGGSVLLMGDGNILAWREANNPQGSTGAFCSLAEQLAASIQFIPDVIASTNDGRNAPRLRILRERTNGRSMLDSTRTVVWVFSALDLATPGWQRVPLELQYSLDSPDIILR